MQGFMAALKHNTSEYDLNDRKADMKKLLVTGASGFLGWNLCKEAKNNWDVTGTFFRHYVSHEDVNMIELDLTNYKLLQKMFNDIKPDAVIHTAGATDPNYCQQHPEETSIINVDAAVNIAGLCSGSKIPYLFTSTDLIFDGLSAPYKENDPVCPVNIYGKQKVLAEADILRIYPGTVICRMPIMFGEPGPASQSFIQPMIKSLKSGEEMKLFVDEFRTPASGKTAARGLLLALQKGKGVLHLGGAERISRYNFGLLLMDVMGIRNAGLKRCQQKDMPMTAPRALDVSLDSSKAFALGYKPLPLREELKILLNSSGLSAV
jgi:dTDP-4-dehydrorhamnose reductase